VVHKVDESTIRLKKEGRGSDLGGEACAVKVVGISTYATRYRSSEFGKDLLREVLSTKNCYLLMISNLTGKARPRTIGWPQGQPKERQKDFRP